MSDIHSPGIHDMLAAQVPMARLPRQPAEPPSAAPEPIFKRAEHHRFRDASFH
jgi:hypothetical protein